jgi:hypothetical protein
LSNLSEHQNCRSIKRSFQQITVMNEVQTCGHKRSLKILIMKRKKIIFPLLLLTLIASGFSYWHFTASKVSLSDTERTKAYEQILGREIKEEKNIEIKDYQGKYFSLKYPSNLSIKEATSSADQKSETLRMLGFDPRVNLVVMAVQENTSISDYSAVKFRAQSEDFTAVENPPEINGLESIVYTNATAPEKTAFLKKGSTIYSISTTGSNMAEVEKLFDQVIQTITF